MTLCVTWEVAVARRYHTPRTLGVITITWGSHGMVYKKTEANPGGIPIPRHPDAARITRARKLRQQLVEAPAAWTGRGLFLWR